MNKKKRLAEYRKHRAPQNPGSGTETRGKKPDVVTISNKVIARREERAKKWELGRLIFQQRLAEEESILRRRLEDAFLKGEKSIAGDPRFSSIPRHLNLLRQNHAIRKITIKDVEKIELSMENLCRLRARCEELDCEVDGREKVRQLLLTIAAWELTGGK